ncbi:MAG: 3-oxoacyl-[acyl-carrier protein] reductase, partial [uncultured Chloroflexia bacterium]
EQNSATRTRSDWKSSCHREARRSTRERETRGKWRTSVCFLRQTSADMFQGSSSLSTAEPRSC